MTIYNILLFSIGFFVGRFLYEFLYKPLVMRYFPKHSIEYYMDLVALDIDNIFSALRRLNKKDRKLCEEIVNRINNKYKDRIQIE